MSDGGRLTPGGDAQLLRNRLVEWVGPASSLILIGVLLAWSWRRWPDFLIDFGRELYVPWQLARGKTLYRDIAYFNGPFSPLWNAALFRLFGPSLRTLALGNALVLALAALMVHHLLRQLTDRWTAMLGSWAMVVFFGFAEFAPRTNYSFIAPYSHEMTHGSALGLAALVLLGAHLRGGGGSTVFALGLAVGCLLLTKAEFAIAVLPAVAIGFVAHHRATATPRRERLDVAIRLAVGVLLPLAAAFLLLVSRLPLDTAVRGMAGSWLHVFNAEVRQLYFYRDIMGTVDIGRSLLRIAGWCLRYACVLAPAALAAALVRRSWRASPVVALLLVPAAAAALLAFRAGIEWENLATPFPLFTFAALVAVSLDLLRRPGDPGDSGRRILSVACLLYAMALLLKMLLNTRILHYGFALAMPAGMVVLALFLDSVPRWIDRRSGNGACFRAVVLGAVAGFAIIQIQALHTELGWRRVPIGSGADRFYADASSRPFVVLLDRLQRLRAPGETSVVLPEGVMVNYLLRMENPTPFLNFMPPELILFGEERIRAAFASRPPDWIVLLDRDAGEYGYRMLGDDYGQRLWAWIETRYEVVERIPGDIAWPRPGPFAALLRRRPE